MEFENQIPPNRVPRAEQPYLWPELASKICYHCGANGHLAQQCPHEGKLCYNCIQFGHVTKDCPEQPRKKYENCSSINNFLLCDIFIIMIL